MIPALFICVVLFATAFGLTWLSYRYQRTPLNPAQLPVAAERPTDFATELAAIDVPAPPNYRSGEYPVIQADIVDETTDQDERGEHVPRHAAEEPLAEQTGVRPWQVPALANERPAIFLETLETGAFPVLDLDLSATNAWGSADRAALQALLDMDREDAA